ncbi:MAG: DUF1684 domain-containing protein [Candidatus Latescibacteria bacterium]|nr:DUF1684 domain-containing protein [bacterium]MBD3423354.1 DUF1684 domain-containing protein [Candidatus Latescibacterota bacterium]
MDWRGRRTESMRDSTSWLTIAGLFWLEEGASGMGSAPDNRIVLPPGSAPPYMGELILNNGLVSFRAAEGIEANLNGRGVSAAVLGTGAEGEPDRLRINELSMWIIERGGRLALRLRDYNARRFREFKKLDFYPPEPQYRIEARFVPYDSARTVLLPTAVGTEAEMKSPGYALFDLKGKELRLELLEGGEDGYFIIFSDMTSGRETYGAGRFLSTGRSRGDTLEINFNRAVNPPCAYTPYATCPLPPPENHLQVRIEAGEKKYPGSWDMDH